MDGVPLEDGGDQSTSRTRKSSFISIILTHFAESHWEKRIFRNEYMTGSADPSPVISAITLALLEGIVL